MLDCGCNLALLSAGTMQLKVVAGCPEPAVLWFSVDPRRRIHHAIQCVVVSPLDWLICRSGAVGTPRPQIDDIPTASFRSVPSD